MKEKKNDKLPALLKNVLNFSFQTLLKIIKRQTTELGENIFKTYVQPKTILQNIFKND